MNKTVLRVTTLFILLLAIILLPSITSAETNSIIVKQTKDYIIYNESMMNEEFTFAFSDTNEKTNLIFFPSAKDANSTDAKNVGVEETDPRRPHFVVTGEHAETGVGNWWDRDGEIERRRFQSKTSLII